jgi:hypothetical protein
MKILSKFWMEIAFSLTLLNLVTANTNRMTLKITVVNPLA